MPIQPPIAMLLVEDDLGHARLITKNLERAGLSSHAVVLHDGQQALDYLFKKNQYVGAEHSLPQLMLLDLNLPGLDGYHVLSRVKGDVCTQHMMVVVFTTTDNPQEISKAYALGLCISLFAKLLYQCMN